MTIRKFILATTILTAATGYAFAQSGPAPANTLDSNTKASPPTAPTDNSAASASGNDQTRGSASGIRGSATTGAGMGMSGGSFGASSNETKQKDISPGSQSPASGIQKEK